MAIVDARDVGDDGSLDCGGGARADAVCSKRNSVAGSCCVEHDSAALPAGAGLSSRDADNLRDIWLFLNRLRWRHQLHNKVTNNLVSVSDLSSIEKHQLKAAFQAIERAQQAAVMKFSGGMS